jgi:hypothetical protein
MKKSMWLSVPVGVLVAAIGVWVLQASATENPAESPGEKVPTTKPAMTEQQFYRMQAAHLSAAIKSIDQAVGAVETGEKETALAQLKSARQLITQAQEALERRIEPKFVNVKCPIQGTPINPDKVTDQLIREYKGQKIAFCCAGCPQAWDKLTDFEKEAKLAEALPAKPQTNPHHMKQEGASEHQHHQD